MGNVVTNVCAKSNYDRLRINSVVTNRCRTDGTDLSSTQSTASVSNLSSLPNTSPFFCFFLCVCVACPWRFWT